MALRPRWLDGTCKYTHALWKSICALCRWLRYPVPEREAWETRDERKQRLAILSLEGAEEKATVRTSMWNEIRFPRMYARQYQDEQRRTCTESQSEKATMQLASGYKHIGTWRSKTWYTRPHNDFPTRDKGERPLLVDTRWTTSCHGQESLWRRVYLHLLLASQSSHVSFLLSISYTVAGVPTIFLHTDWEKSELHYRGHCQYCGQHRNAGQDILFTTMRRWGQKGKIYSSQKQTDIFANEPQRRVWYCQLQVTIFFLPPIYLVKSSLISPRGPDKERPWYRRFFEEPHAVIGHSPEGVRGEHLPDTWSEKHQIWALTPVSEFCENSKQN